MKKIIHHIRKQQEEVRRHILHICIIIAGIILLSLWVYSLGTNMKDVSVQEQTDESPNPFSVLKNNLALPEW